MKPAILSLLVMTCAAATAAVAQEGSSQGPPHSPVIIGKTSTVPTGTSSTAPTGTPHKLVAAPPK